LFHRVASEGDVSWSAGGKEDPGCIAADFRQSKPATLQWSRSDRNRCQAFSRSALRHRVSPLAPCPKELLSGWRPDSPIVLAVCISSESYRSIPNASPDFATERFNLLVLHQLERVRLTT